LFGGKLNSRVFFGDFDLATRQAYGSPRPVRHPYTRKRAKQ